MTNGTSQSERALTALSPAYLKVDERSVDDLYRDMQNMAKAMKFYGSSAETTGQDWTPFFADLDPHFKKLLATPFAVDAPNPRNLPPHLSLLLAFIKLYGHAQARLNALPSAHLNFFYRKVLGEERKRSIPDKVYVFFELARNIDHYVLQKGEQLLAGKDEKGNERIYTTDYKLFLTHSKLVKFKALQRSVKRGSSIYAFPAVNSSDGFGKELDVGEGWFPFGDLSMQKKSAEIGFAIASPALLLKEGKRTIRFSFALQHGRKPTVNSKVSSNDLVAHLTSDKGWVTCDVSDFVYDKNHIALSVELGAGDPPVVVYNESLHGYSLTHTRGAILKITLKDGFSFDQYTFLQSLHFTSVTVTTQTLGATGVVVRNDYGEIDAMNAFHPFGYHPVRGSNFYITYPEALQKNVESATLHISWKGLPDDFKKYYEGYKGETNSLVGSNDDFKVKAAIRLDRKWHDLPNSHDRNGEYSLFTGDIALDLKTLSTTRTAVMGEGGSIIRLTLSAPPDAFGHSLYPAEYAKAIVGKLENKEVPIPNEPYTPVVEDIEFSYVATHTIDAGQVDETRSQFYHVKPFGISPIRSEKNVKTFPFISDEFYYGGSFFMGIQALSPPQQLSIFFKIKESTYADKPNVGYFFLASNGWRAFKAEEVLTDTTRGLQATGFLVLNLPEQMTAGNDTMERGLFWIMISVNDDASNFDQIVAVRTNGVSCTSHHAQASPGWNPTMVLPPDAITTLAKRKKEIKKVAQPYSSFGGRAAEEEDDYFLRVSEKLRHKGRAISVWDIERIILDQFPEIYKVKCIQHTDTTGAVAPGSIHIIVISYIRQFHHSRIVRPFVASTTLTKIRRQLAQLISPHVKVNVTNPDYHEIKVVAQINFNTQVDEGHYIKTMETDLQHFLSPWTSGGDSDVQLGSTLYRSSIIEFIESRPYVNFISTIRILADGRETEDQVIKLNAKSILISSDQHDIESVGLEESQCQMNQGVDEMIIDINFEVE